MPLGGGLLKEAQLTPTAPLMESLVLFNVFQVNFTQVALLGISKHVGFCSEICLCFIFFKLCYRILISWLVT